MVSIARTDDVQSARSIIIDVVKQPSLIVGAVWLPRRFWVSQKGPKLTKKPCACMSVSHAFFCADFHWERSRRGLTLSSPRGARAAGVWGRVRNDFPSLSGDASGCRGSGERQPCRRPRRTASPVSGALGEPRVLSPEGASRNTHSRSLRVLNRRFRGSLNPLLN